MKSLSARHVVSTFSRSPISDPPGPARVARYTFELRPTGESVQCHRCENGDRGHGFWLSWFQKNICGICVICGRLFRSSQNWLGGTGKTWDSGEDSARTGVWYRVAVPSSLHDLGFPEVGEEILYRQDLHISFAPRIIAHELGHAVFGIGDAGPGRLSNVLANENPIMLELGEPARTHY